MLVAFIGAHLAARDRMSRQLSGLTLVALTLLAGRVAAQPGYASRTQTAEPPLADDPKAGEKVQAAIQQTRPYIPAVRTSDAPAPSVLLKVQTPAALAVGQNVDVRLVVENVSQVPAKNVLVGYTLPPGGAIVKANPAEQAPGAAAWKFDTLAAGGRQEILLTVKPPDGANELDSKAHVTVDQEQSSKTRFAKADMKVSTSAPKQALRFDILVLGVTVENRADMELKDVVITDKLPAGLLHKPDDDKDKAAKLAGPVTDDGLTRTWKIDRLGPHESRRFEYYVAAATAPAGAVQHQVVAQAGGGAQSTATDKIDLIDPKLTLKVDAPPRRSASMPAAVRVTLTNSGPRLLQNIVVSDTLDQGRVDSVGPGGQKLRDNLVQWIVPSLGPNRTQVLELVVSKSDGGRVQQKLSAVYRGLNLPAEAATEFEAVASLAYDFRSSSSTVEVGGEVDYELTVRNAGSAPATNLRPMIDLPPELLLVKAEPPENKADGGKVTFEPLASLPPNGRAIFRVKAKAQKPSVGAIVTAQLGGDPFPTGPVTRQEHTAIGASPPAATQPVAPSGVPLPMPVPPPPKP
jgi:uncharacterized repeat protein (TIGR01451 family)